uniref:F-box domain-containing protein n=1 Tax=Stomoxys calcitrans TaxID=35570 RepID=A0A1I8PVR2_STOCA
MDAAQKLINNLVILSKILEYLSLEEQVKCLEISKSFRHAITTVLWKKHYRELNLYKTPYISIINKKSQDSGEDLVTLQEIQEFKTSLKYDKCNVFLRSLAPHVHKLSVFSEYFIFRHNMGVAFRNIQKFINLRQLNFTQMVVTSDHMELIAAKCRRLRRLEFIECISETWNPLLPGYNLDIATLGQLRYLSDLTLQCQLMENPPTLECNIVHELLSKLRLKRLVMRNLNIVDFGSDTVQHIMHGGCVEVLHVGNISLEFWPHFKHHLKEFHNLSDLFINVVDCNTLLSSPDLELLANHCPKLLKLTLENCDLEVADFGLY